MPSHIIGDLLVTTEELKSLSLRTRRLRELQTLYFGSAPRELAGSSRVKSYKAGVLCVTADNGAVAAKLKQLAPTVLAAIRKNEPEVTGLRIEVQVRESPAPKPRQSQKTLSPQAVEYFDALSQQVGGEDLKLALANLVTRHRRTKGRSSP
jgi:hypothetical protein